MIPVGSTSLPSHERRFTPTRSFKLKVLILGITLGLLSILEASRVTDLLGSLVHNVWTTSIATYYPPSWVTSFIELHDIQT